MAKERIAEARLLSTCLGISRWLDASGDVRPGAETRLRGEIDGKLADVLLGACRRERLLRTA